VNEKSISIKCIEGQKVTKSTDDPGLSGFPGEAKSFTSHRYHLCRVIVGIEPDIGYRSGTRWVTG
jgi:hypothetical protein